MKLNDLKLPLDYYELKARVAPAIFLSVPVLLTLWSCFKEEFTGLSDIFKGIISLVIIYVFSIIVRASRKKIEPELWESWGGAPSIQIVSWKNEIIGNELKELYLQAVREKLRLPAPTKEEEEADPIRAADLNKQAFKRIQGIIRQKDKDGLWSIANADYGFARNLLGSRMLWFIISAVMSIISGYSLYSEFSKPILIGLVANAVMVLASIYVGWYILPEYTRQVAFRYAEHSWESFYNAVQAD
jgi:hypothetical protein